MRKNQGKRVCISQESSIFAVAMQSDKLLNINLAQASEAAERLNIELTDRFFADLEQEEISGGDIHVEIFVKASAGDIYNVNIKADGHVTVACDRCLDPLDIEVETSDTLKVKDADPEDCDAPEMLYLEAGNPCFDFSWLVYEIIETALPMQRVHPEGLCNKEMLSYITAEENGDEDDWDN